MLSVFIFGQPFEGLSYPFLDFGQPFKFFAIRLSGYGIRLNARVNRLLSVYNRFSRPFNGKALVSVFPWRSNLLLANLKFQVPGSEIWLEILNSKSSQLLLFFKHNGDRIL